MSTSVTITTLPHMVMRSHYVHVDAITLTTSMSLSDTYQHLLESFPNTFPISGSNLLSQNTQRDICSMSLYFKLGQEVTVCQSIYMTS